MSGEGATPNKETRKRKSEFQYAIEAMKEQWGSMLAMAAMFVGTIALGMLLQPFYNQSDELRAFGKEGASQGRWILLELMMIFAFTALIIWLAKKKKEWIIKTGILVILWLALVYATVPLAHLVLAPDMSPDPFVMEEVAVGNESGGSFISHLGTTGFMMYDIEPLLDEEGEPILDDDNASLFTHSIEVTSEEDDWKWQTQLDMPDYNLRVTEQSDSFVVSGGELMWVLDRNGTEIDSDICLRATFPAVCSLSFNHSIDGQNYTYSITHEPRLVRYHPNKDIGADFPPAVTDGQWFLPFGMNIGEGQLMALKVAEGRMLVVDNSYASLFKIPETNSGQTGGKSGPAEYVEEIWNYSVNGITTFTAVEWGISPWAEDNLSAQSGNEMMLLLGTESGDVKSWNFNIADDEVSEEKRMLLAGNDALEGPIDAIRLGDYGDGGWNELFVAGGGTLHMFRGANLIDYMHIDYDASDAIHILPNEEGAVVSWYSEGNWSGGQLNDEMLIKSGIQLDPLSSWVGLIVSTVLMVWLIWRPEWYVVNTTGVLVGSGVVVMLGVAFVPWLVIIFMLLAAIYDHWAVHKSKHMLDLADTMIGLNLPILLVAPQEKGFSMLDDGGDDEDEEADAEDSEDDESTEESTSEQEAAPSASVKKDGFKAKAEAAEAARASGQQPVKKPKNGGAEAMFMGLGDIIFPGMLVISAMTYLAPVGGESAALWVAIGVIIGGLFGYLILMTRVALGIPQAGLPLLNGGSILGYIVFGLAFIGWKALEFNITL